MKRKTTVMLLLAALMIFATTRDSIVGEDSKENPTPQTWHFKFKVALGVSQSRNRPLLVLVSARFDTSSWEAEQAVIKTQRFAEQSSKFTLCQAESGDKDFATAAKGTSVPLGALVFFDSAGNLLEIAKWDGHPEKMLDTLERVAAGNSVAELEKKGAGGDIQALKTLYGIYSADMHGADLALATLQKIFAAEPDSKKFYEGDELYWEILKKSAQMKPADAVEQITAAIPKVKSREKNETLQVLLARARFHADEQQKAVTEIARFIKNHQQSQALELAYENMFTMLMYAQDKDKALQFGAGLLVKFPYNRTVLNYLNATATKCYADGEYQKAERIFQALAKLSPATAAGANGDFMYRAMANGTAVKDRAATLRAAKDVLYIVPDLATYLAYISEWDAKSFFPIMIDRGTPLDKRLITKFAAAFKPTRIIRVAKSVGRKLTEDFARKAVLASFDERSWSEVEKAGPDEFKAFYTASKLSPLGIVLVDVKSPGLLAGGAALAAGHAQIIDFYSTGLKCETEIKYEGAEKIRKEIAAKIAAWGYAWDSAFDDIDFLTLACEIPLQFKHLDFHKYSTDDFIARRDNDIRYAWCGRLMDCADTTGEYMAMCSLFLKPQNALFFDAYKDRGGYSSYASEKAAAQLKASGLMSVDYLGGKEASLEKWREINKVANTYNMIFINSAGGAADWITGSGKATTADVPDESIPTIVHMTHSFSAANPYSVSTIAGKWIAAGAYIYYGSVEEPFLTAFRSPGEYVPSILEKEPLSMAFRRRFGRAFWRAWRLVYIGDPLNTPAVKAVARLSASDTALRPGEAEVESLEKLFPEKTGG